jgi:hypothetical protein
MTSNLKILFRNVNTLTYEKLQSVCATKAEIYCFAEIRQNDSYTENLKLSDYDAYFQTRPPTSLSSNRTFGGVAVYIKSSLMRGIKRLSTSTSDVLWIQLKKEEFGLALQTMS